MTHHGCLQAGRFAAPVFALALLATSAVASKSKPESGPIGLKWGETKYVDVFGVNKCNFDYAASLSMDGIVCLDKTAGTNVLKDRIGFTAVGEGSTTLTIMTMAGTNPCPMAVHVFNITVTPDVAGIVSKYSQRAKTEFSELRLELKAEYNFLKTDLLGLKVQYKDEGTLDADQYATNTFNQYTESLVNMGSRSSDALRDLSKFGKKALSGNPIPFAEGPLALFPGACLDFDKFRSKVNTEFEKNFDGAKKLTKSALAEILKKDHFQVLLTTDFIAARSRGPLYPEQTDTPHLTTPTRIMSVLSRPTNNMNADNGFLLGAGFADSDLGGTFEVSLIKSVNGNPDTTVVLTPTIDTSTNYWQVTFPNLTPGHYRLRAGFQGDFANTEFLAYVPKFSTH
jgi:hypothetical protein